MDSKNARPVAFALADRWWGMVIRGVAAILFGILAFARPGTAILSLVYIWALFALVDGAVALMLTPWSAAAKGRWGWLLVQGLVSIAAGIVTFAWPGITASILLTIIAVWAVARGIAEIATAIRLRRVLDGEWMLGLSGVLSIAFGVMLFASPMAGAMAVAWIIGTYAVAIGALLIVLGVRLHGWRRGVERDVPSGGAPTPA